MTTDIDDKQERERFEPWFSGNYISNRPSNRHIAWEAWQARAALDTGADGWIYYNPDTGPEWSEQHPIESGEVPDALEVREATFAAVKAELLAAWDVAAPQPTASASAGKVEPVAGIACEGHPQAPNDPCAVCGKSGDTQPVAVAWMADAGKRSTWTLHKSKHDAFLASEACGGSILPLYTAPPSRPDARQAAEEMREQCAGVVQAWINQPNDCEAYGGVDPKTGVYECALEASGRDCICNAQVEAAEEILQRIRSLPLPGDKEG